MTNEIPELKVENLVVRYDTEDAKVHAVNDISFEVYKGTTMGLVGPLRRCSPEQKLRA